mmetsp:Transcript_3977/g.7934  ORF Transcript_3977/g.7934 Transcript_3977/m.7934 type:complete len:122 (-) Transcript_3977:2026-2391(-)
MHRRTERLTDSSFINESLHSFDSGQKHKLYEYRRYPKFQKGATPHSASNIDDKPKRVAGSISSIQCVSWRQNRRNPSQRGDQWGWAVEAHSRATSPVKSHKADFSGQSTPYMGSSGTRTSI